MSGHTPGPWMARPNEPDNGEWEVVKPDPNKPYAEDPWFVCLCYDDADGFSGEGNARLIAAAHDLLEALEKLLAVVRGEGGTKPDAHGMCERALAKARGEA